MTPPTGFRRKLGEPAALRDQAVGREDADAATVGDDREAVPFHAHGAAERLDHLEQLVQGLDPKHPGPAEGGVIDRVRSGERAGGRLCCLDRFVAAARLDHHDRLGARCGPRRRRELPGVGDRLA